MAHEMSQTVERDGRFFNVYGRDVPRSGQPLPKMFPWEQDSYPTEAEAVAAARRRSEQTDPATLRPRSVEVELPSGEVIEFPADMPQQEVQMRAQAIMGHVAREGRMPAKVEASGTGAFWTVSAPPEPARAVSVDTILKSGLVLRDAVRSGQREWTSLSMPEKLSVGLATRQIGMKDLGTEGQRLLGLPLSIGESFVSGLRDLGVPETPGGPRPPVKNIVAGLTGQALGGAGRALYGAVMEPAEGPEGQPFRGAAPFTTMARKGFKQIIPEVIQRNWPKGVGDPLSPIELAERAMIGVFGAPIEAFAHLQPPGPSREASRMLGLTTLMGRKMDMSAREPTLRRAVRREVARVPEPWEANVERELRRELQPSGNVTGLIGEATDVQSTDPFGITARRAGQRSLTGEVTSADGFEILDPARQTRRQLPPSPRIRELASPDAEVVESAPAGARTVPIRDITADVTASSRTAGPEGATGFDIIGRGPAFSTPVRPESRTPALSGQVGAPRALPPYIDFERVAPDPSGQGRLPLSGSASDVPPSPPREPVAQRAKSPQQVYAEWWKERRNKVDIDTVNITDPDEVRVLIEGQGGLAKTRDYPDFPWFFFKRARGSKGRAFDELVDEIAKTQNRRYRDVERTLAHTINRYASLKAEKQARIARGEHLGSQAASEDLYAREFEPPSAEAGSATTAAAFPDKPSDVATSEWAKWSPTERQQYLDFVNGWDEMQRRGGAPGPSTPAGFVPPIPVPGPPDDERPWVRALWRTAQGLGLAAPLFGMAARGRGRRPVQGRLEGMPLERAAGPQRSPFEPPGKVAPVTFGGIQEGVRGGRMELWTLTEDIPGHPVGSTVSRRTLEEAGYTVPPAPGGGPRGSTSPLEADRTPPAEAPRRAPDPQPGQEQAAAEPPPGRQDRPAVSGPREEPRLERTPLGDQAVIPGTPGHAMPPTPLRAPDRGAADTPLFRRQEPPGPEQLPLGEEPRRPVERVPAPVLEAVRWRSARPPAGALDAWASEDGRFRVVQTDADTWVVKDRTTGRETSTPTFHEARQWVDRQRRDQEPPRPGDRISSLPPAALVGAGAAASAIKAWLDDHTIRPGMLPTEDEFLDAAPPSDWKRWDPPPSSGAGNVALAGPLGGFGRVRGPREVVRPSGEPYRVPGGTEPARVDPRFRFEDVRPPERAGGARGGEPPPGAPDPPAREESVPDGRGGRVRFEQLRGAAREIPELGRRAYATLLGRFERWGPGGEEMSRLVQRVSQQTSTFYGQHVQPIVDRLDRLSPAEKENFVEVADVGARPMNAAVDAAYRDYQRVFGEDGLVPREAHRRDLMTTLGGGETRPFQARPQFFPHEFDPAYVREILRPGSPTRRRKIQELAEREGLDEDTAALVIDGYFRQNPRDRFVGGLERGREVNIDGWIRDPAVAVGIRGWKVSRRFAELDQYGHRDGVVGQLWDPVNREPGSGLLNQIEQRFGRREAEKASVLFSRLVEKPPEEQAFQNLARTVMTAEAFTKLPLAFIVNFSQPGLTALRTSLGTTARAFAQSLRHPTEGAQIARDLGTLSRESVRELYQELTGTPELEKGVGRTVMDWAMTPFNISERWNIIVSSRAGQMWASKVDRWLQNGERTDFVRRELERLNFSREEIAVRMRERRLQGDDAARIAWSVVDQTQFLERKARRSEFFSSPLGQAVGQFKTFAINEGRLLNQMVVKEALRNRDPGVIANLAVSLGIVFPIVGELVLDARSLARSRQREHGIDNEADFALRLLENFMAVGGIGLASDFVETANQRGVRGIGSFLMGPGANDAAEIIYRSIRQGANAGKADWDKMARDAQSDARYAVRQVPFVGPQLSNALRNDAKAQKEAALSWQQKLGLDPMETRLRKLEQLDRRMQSLRARANQLAAEGKVDEANELLRAFNEANGTALRLNPRSIKQRQQRERGREDPDEALRQRQQRLRPELRGRLLQDLEPPAPR